VAEYRLGAMNDRHPHRPVPRRLAGTVVALAILAAGCAAAGSPGPSAPGSSTPAPSTGATLSQAQAIAAVLAADPQFAGIGPLDPNLIGQSAWYEVSPATVGWRVVITKGWGDCPAGCISRHTWTYDVDGVRGVVLVDEGGDPLPDGSGGPGDGSGGVVPGSPPVPIPADGGPWIAGRALAGPTCPVVQNPPDPACADRPVASAVIVIRDGSGSEVARATTAADGTFLVAVPGGGAYAVEAQPVDGLMGTPPAVTIEVGDAASAWAATVVPYDTGIR
jgi:hypothetical protein